MGLTPTMGQGQAHPDGPPISLRNSNFELYNYLQMIHSHLFGLGGDTGDIDAFHKELGTHSQVNQGTAVTDLSGTITASTIMVDSADATNGSETSQVTLGNEMKSDLNNHITEYNLAVVQLNSLVSKFNALLASLRAGKVIAT